MLKARRGDVSTGGLGAGDRKALEPEDRIRVSPDYSTGVDEHVRGGGYGVNASEVRASSEDVGLAVGIDLGGGEHDARCAAELVVEVVILFRGGRFGELDVVDDRARPVSVQDLDRSGVIGAREGPGDAKLRERLVVDPDNNDISGPSHRTEREPRVDRDVLQLGPEVPYVGQYSHRSGEEACQQHNFWPQARGAAPESDRHATVRLTGAGRFADRIGLQRGRGEPFSAGGVIHHAVGDEIPHRKRLT